MVDRFVNFVIRPPRAEYNPDQSLWGSEFTVADRKYKRRDLELTNGRGHKLQCSHYVPSLIPEGTILPCVIYCHGNSGCRADANGAAVILLPSNITVFTLDFSGSGLSGGDYVSLGWHEKEDLKVVVSYLRNSKQVSSIGLWGRSMGAATSLLYGAEDPSIAGMVIDSPFSNLMDIMMELVDVYKIQVPKFTVKMTIQYMRRIIQKKAKFDIMALNIVQFAPKICFPALFGHGLEDKFILPHHTDRICKSYAGEKEIIKFEGNHNSARPQVYYDSVSAFFYNVLHPPPISSTSSNKEKKYTDMGDLRLNSGIDENLLYEIINGVRTADNNVRSSSSVPPGIPLSSGSTVKSVVELIEECVSSISEKDEIPLHDEANSQNDGSESASDDSHSQDKANVQNEDGSSYTSSIVAINWASYVDSLGGGTEELSQIECPGVSNGKKQESINNSEQPQLSDEDSGQRQMVVKKRNHLVLVPHKHNHLRTFMALTSPLRLMNGLSSAKLKEKKKGLVAPPRDPKHAAKLEKGETRSQVQRLTHYFIPRRPYHVRHQSV